MMVVRTSHACSGLDVLSIGDATALYMTFPCWACLMVICVHRCEGLSVTQPLVAAGCFSGVVLLTRPAVLGAGAPMKPAAVALMLAAAVCMATAVVSMQWLPRGTDPRTVTNYLFALTVAGGIPALLVSGEPLMHGRGARELFLLGLHGVAAYGAQACLVSAVMLGSAVVTVPSSISYLGSVLTRVE